MPWALRIAATRPAGRALIRRDRRRHGALQLDHTIVRGPRQSAVGGRSSPAFVRDLGRPRPRSTCSVPACSLGPGHFAPVKGSTTRSRSHFDDADEIRSPTHYAFLASDSTSSRPCFSESCLSRMRVHPSRSAAVPARAPTARSTTGIRAARSSTSTAENGHVRGEVITDTVHHRLSESSPPAPLIRSIRTENTRRTRATSDVPHSGPTDLRDNRSDLGRIGYLAVHPQYDDGGELMDALIFCRVRASSTIMQRLVRTLQTVTIDVRDYQARLPVRHADLDRLPRAQAGGRVHMFPESPVAD